MLTSERFAFACGFELQLVAVANNVDSTFPDNGPLRIGNGEPILTKLEKKKAPLSFSEVLFTNHHPEELMPHVWQPAEITDVKDAPQFVSV